MGNRYVVLSPDGFTIHPEDVYVSKKQAMVAFEDWKKKFEVQGHYSSNSFGKIPLERLEDYCEIKKLN